MPVLIVAKTKVSRLLVSNTPKQASTRDGLVLAVEAITKVEHLKKSKKYYMFKQSKFGLPLALLAGCMWYVLMFTGIYYYIVWYKPF